MTRVIQGVPLSALQNQFTGCVQGRTLILDGDGPCYVASSTVKRLDTAVRQFQQIVLTQMFLTKSESARIHLTASGSRKAGRFEIIAQKPYQGNRNGKAKPPLLEPLREAVAHRSNWLAEYEVIMHHELEADDGMIIDAHRLKEDGLIWSDDKDLRMTPYPYWEKDRGVIMPSEPVGYLQPKYTGAGVLKLVGQGPMFFWAQMLMGDTADNIKGILRYDGRLCGPAVAYAVLKDYKDINEIANAVLDAYRVIDQNPLPEGYLLWLLRWPGDSFLNYLGELELSAQNKEFVNECKERVWRSERGASGEQDQSSVPECRYILPS